MSPVPGPGVEVVQDPDWDNHTIIIKCFVFEEGKKEEASEVVWA